MTSGAVEGTFGGGLASPPLSLAAGVSKEGEGWNIMISERTHGTPYA